MRLQLFSSSSSSSTPQPFWRLTKSWKFRGLNLGVSKRFSLLHLHPDSCMMETSALCLGQSGWSVALSTHLRLGPRLKTSTATLLFPVCVYMSFYVPNFEDRPIAGLPYLHMTKTYFEVTHARYVLNCRYIFSNQPHTTYNTR